MSLLKTTVICMTILFIVLCITAGIVTGIQKATPETHVVERHELNDLVFGQYRVVYVKDHQDYRLYETYDVDTNVMYVIIESNNTYSIEVVYDNDGLPKRYLPDINDTPIIEKEDVNNG